MRMVMTQEEKEECVQTKACFNLENLHFYRGQYGKFHCKYINDPYDFENEDILDLRFILSSLSMQQGKIFFDDINDCCTGIDKLKEKYLVFKLAGLI
jgi:hypothetical protein